MKDSTSQTWRPPSGPSALTFRTAMLSTICKQSATQGGAVGLVYEGGVAAYVEALERGGDSTV